MRYLKPIRESSESNKAYEEWRKLKSKLNKIFTYVGIKITNEIKQTENKRYYYGIDILIEINNNQIDNSLLYFITDNDKFDNISFPNIISVTDNKEGLYDETNIVDSNLEPNVMYNKIIEIVKNNINKYENDLNTLRYNLIIEFLETNKKNYYNEEMILSDKLAELMMEVISMQKYNVVTKIKENKPELFNALVKKYPDIIHSIELGKSGFED